MQLIELCHMVLVLVSHIWSQNVSFSVHTSLNYTTYAAVLDRNVLRASRQDGNPLEDNKRSVTIRIAVMD